MKTIVFTTGYQQFCFHSCVTNNKVIWTRVDHSLMCFDSCPGQGCLNIFQTSCNQVPSCNYFPTYPHRSTLLGMTRGGCKDRALHVHQQCSRQNQNVPQPRGAGRRPNPLCLLMKSWDQISPEQHMKSCWETVKDK